MTENDMEEFWKNWTFGFICGNFCMLAIFTIAGLWITS